ncbi:chemotaxis protein CheB [Stenotrophomonas sp. JC08]|uniref:chemotaxis protein CheB n=1 Tax=Stenotrophomonas sp. JC08 TaxID=3445779 RepID=UPI003FA1D673
MFASDDNNTRPVALLALEGVARERLREAIVAAGGRVVLEADPNTLDPAALEASGSGVVLVALEPAVEDALERFDAVFESPHYSLMFEEAEVIVRREGWEAQRWIRHLAAKLQGHDNVLPPGPEEDVLLQPEPGMPVTPAELHADAPLQFHLDEAQQLADAVPADGLYAAGADAVAPAPEVMSFEELMAQAESHRVTADQATPSPAAVQPPPLPPLEPSVDAATPGETVAAPATGGFDSWSLLDDADYAAAPAAPAAAAESPALASFLSSSLSLVEAESEEGAGAANGAVLLLAGIGGPDAVRRLLSGLPEEFPRPVLVQMRLDGGRYANLVKQMSRATALPVLLAEAGEKLEPGNIYILADGTGLQSGNDGLRFSQEAAQLVTLLPAAGSAVVMLSGADPALVGEVLAFAAQGGWAAGQSGDGCYDPEAASQLIVAGMPGGDPEYLAGELAMRCAG